MKGWIRVFAESGFKPTAVMLERTVAKSKSLLELLGEGADGREIALKLVRIVTRGSTSRSKLDAVLGERKSLSLEISDVGRKSFPEAV